MTYAEIMVELIVERLLEFIATDDLQSRVLYLIQRETMICP